MKLVFLKYQDRFICTRILKVRSVIFFDVELCFILCLKSVAQSGLVYVLCLGQLLSEFFYLLPEIIVVLGGVLVYFHFHFQYFGPFSKHQS